MTNPAATPRAGGRVLSPTRAVALLGAFAIAVVALASETYLFAQRSRDLAHAVDEASSASRIIGEQKARALQSVDLVLDGVAERIGDLRQARLAENDYLVHVMLRSRISSMPHIGALFVVDEAGAVVNASADFPIQSVNVADREYFQFHRGRSPGEVFIGPPLINRMGGEWTVHMSRAIKSDDGRFAGVVVAALNLDYFENFNDLKLDYITPVSLYLRDGRLLTRTPRDERLLGRPFVLPPVLPGSSDSKRIAHVEGEQAGVVIYRDIDNFPLTLAVSTLERAALAGWRQNALAVRIGATVGALFIMLSTLLLMREVRREQRLSASLAQTGKTLQALVDTALDAIITVDDELNIVLFNPAAETLFGCKASAALGRPIEQFLPVGEGRAPGARLPDQQAVGRHHDGSEFPVEASVSELTSNGRTMTTVVLRDISERLRAEAALGETNAELSRLSKSLIAVRESERTRIARELHDELGQQLMRLRLDLSWLGGRLRESRPELDAKVTEMKGLVADTVASVRRITTELRPPLLDDLGPVAAVEWLLDDFALRTGLQINATIDPAADRCDAETGTAIYRILQEALTNVARHGQASKVRVLLSDSGDRLFMEIEDNGKGLSQASSSKVNAGNGLVGIRERVLMLGGQIEFGSGTSGGLAISIDLPMPGPAAVLPGVSSKLAVAP